MLGLLCSCFTGKTLLRVLKLLEPPVEQSRPGSAKSVVIQSAEGCGDPLCPFAQSGEIRTREAQQKRFGELASAVEDAFLAWLPVYETPAYHQQQASLDEAAPHKELGRSHGQFGMQAFGAANVAGMNDQVIECDEALEIERSRMRRYEDCNGPDARLERGVERQIGVARAFHVLSQVNRSSLASWWQMPRLS
jgi:hypothetical protein